MSHAKNDKPRFSRGAVNRAGERLVVDPTDEEALEVLDYWRGLHAGMLGNELETGDSISLGFITVNGSARIKRTVSILEKLKRYPTMNLSRMQDIAGIRFVIDFSPKITPTIQEFHDYVCSFQKYFSSSYVLKTTDNYVNQPKSSGYRAAHLIYEHQSSVSPQYNSLYLEIQLRTRLQHLWAMAVETVGMFYGQALKASLGDQGWLDFFRLASAALSHVEKSPVVAEHAEKSFDQIRAELLHEGNEKTFFSKLEAIKEVDEKYSAEDYDYWLLELNIKKSENRIFGFKSDQIETAREMYSAKEQTPACRRGDVQVVLVSTQSFKDLRQAYPSYFLDVAEFTKTIHQICDKI